MKKPIFNTDELKDFGFIEQEKGLLDDGDFYRFWKYTKNDSELCITYEFNENYKFLSGHIEFNSEVLKGKTITKNDLQLLKQIM